MRLPALPAAGPSVVAAALSPEDDVPEPHLTRVRQLLLIQRDPEALAELRRLPAAPGVQATIAWLEWRSGRLRPAINAMKRALPGHLGAAGDQLPGEVWRILYPLDFGDEIRRTAAQEGVDPALVAALICQESTFDSGAVSPAGARGLMQVMPPTGRVLARSLGLTLRKSTLHDPDVSVGLGTRYLREMLDRFGGRVERALAAYNAGPHRVESWTAGRPDVSAEEFVEGIPFTETRNYVMTILAARETYRRLYGLGPPSTSAADASAPAGARRP
jgi:soluble lytic murein transglycosylase